MGSRRTDRLNEQFKREITRIVHREVRDPRVSRPTVTEVEVTPDLWMARVFVRPGPGEEAGPAEEGPSDLVKGLERAAPFIRRRLGEELRLRRIPELRFQEDRTLEKALRIERILREVLPDEGQEEVSPEEGREEMLPEGGQEEVPPEDGFEGEGRGSPERPRRSDERTGE